MESNIKITAIIIIAMAFGVGAGYFIFGISAKASLKTQAHNHDVGAMPMSSDTEIWTCSMHPQIRQNEPGDCPICGMDLIPLDENSSSSPLVLEMTDAAIKLTNIQTTIAGQGSEHHGKTIRLSGKVQPDERLASSQVAHIPGRIEKLFISFTGEQVTKGQKLALLYSPELIVAQRELLEALTLRDLNPDLIDAARNKMRYWKIDEATIDQIEREGKIREKFTVFADESGIVTKRGVSVGDYVKQGQPLFNLMNLSRVWVQFDAYEGDLPSISVGDRISFNTPAVPAKTFKTNVSFIDPVINPNSRVASVRTEVNNARGWLKPEMLVYGTFQKRSDPSSKLTIPKSAVMWTGQRSVVYVKLPDTNIPSFEFREIEIGDALGSDYEVISGLEVGEEIVTYGSFTIDAAAQLNNQASMMNRNVSRKGVDHTGHLPDYTASTPVAFKKQLAKVSEAYLVLKDAFVQSNKDQATKSAILLKETLPGVDMTLVKGDAHLFWMERLEAMQSHTDKITELNHLEDQRTQFAFLSQALIDAIKVFGIPDDVLFVGHCPMALDNQGADWLSRQKEIRNPYFGDAMLACGFIQDTIDKNYRNSIVD